MASRISLLSGTFFLPMISRQILRSLVASRISSADPVSSVEDILRDPAADGVEDEISDSGAESSMFSLLLALSVAADPNPTVSGERDISSTAIPQPITVKQTRKKRRGISKRKDGRSGKVTQNRGLPPTKQTKIISPAKTPVISKDIILIRELQEKLYSAGDLNKKLLKDNKPGEERVVRPNICSKNETFV